MSGVEGPRPIVMRWSVSRVEGTRTLSPKVMFKAWSSFSGRAGVRLAGSATAAAKDDT